MPITRSAAKRVRADRKRRERNLGFKSELKTLTRKFQKLLREGARPQAQEIFTLLVKRWSQAKAKRIVHRNTASRTISRLSRHLHKLNSSKS